MHIEPKVISHLPIDDWEVWACPQQVIKLHGAGAPAHVSARIGQLAIDGDAAGVETWKAIAAKVDQLMDYRSGRPLSRH